MISPAVRPFAIALLFAVGVLAVVLAPSVFFPASVGAHDCDEGPAGHIDFHDIACGDPGHDKPHENVIEVDGGRDNELVFRVFPPGDRVSYLGAGDQIEITLKDFRLSGAEFDSDENANAEFDLIEIRDSGDPTADPIHPLGAEIDSLVLQLHY